jgi:hypothetical protein
MGWVRPLNAIENFISGLAVGLVQNPVVDVSSFGTGYFFDAPQRLI